MILRPYQKHFVKRSLNALKAHGNSIGVAPTGAGKALMLSAVTGQWLAQSNGKACVLAHRDELTQQNEAKFKRINPQISTSRFDALDKDWNGQTTFAMVQTLSRERHVDEMPPLDLLVIDEAHHAAAPSYRRIIDAARAKNPDMAVYGVTATPNRGDKKALRPVFNNVADEVALTDLIRSGYLVPPKTFVMDIGVHDALLGVKKSSDDYDMHQVEAILDSRVLNERVVKHWKDKAGSRKSVVFCSTVDHARHVCEAFLRAEVKAAVIDGAMSKAEREKAIVLFDKGDTQVLVNCMVLTEGFDSQPVSCVVLLRPSSQKSTFVQMIGRGLRVVDPNLYPGVNKTDCIVLDFGTSSRLHGCLEARTELGGRSASDDSSTKACPECSAEVPAHVNACPLCGYAFCDNSDEKNDDKESANESGAKAELTDFVMSEFDLLKRSSFQWCELFGDDTTMMATGFIAWGGTFCLNGQWYGIGGVKNQPPRLLAKGEHTLCLAAADDWLNEHESEEGAIKSKRWLSQPPTDSQLHYLPTHYRHDFGLTRYKASCLLAFLFNKRAINALVFNAAEHTEAA